VDAEIRRGSTRNQVPAEFFSGGRWSAAQAKYDMSTSCARKLHWYEETLPKSRMTPLQLKRTCQKFNPL